MITQSVKEVTKFTPELFAEALVDILSRAEFDKIDGSVCVATDIHHNEEQNILTIKISDDSIFYIKIK